MLASPMDVLKSFPIRKTQIEKQAFRDAVQSYVTELDYPFAVEEGSFGCKNIVIGHPEQAKYLVTAHYDTPARLPFPNSIAPTNRLLTIVKNIPMFFMLFLVSYFAGYLLGKGHFLLGSGLFALVIGLFLLMRIGPANKSNANDNTSGVITVLEILRTVPAIQRDQVCFVLFDLEEAGLIGAQSYRKAHKAATENQIVLNLDCVGDGDEIWFFPSKKLKMDVSAMAALKRCSGWFGQKQIIIREKGHASYPSDHTCFPLSVGIGAFTRKKGVGPYLTRIHTAKDTVLDETNVNLLRACISTLISCAGN